MSQIAKSARAKLKNKAKTLGGAGRPLEKVDSSTWTPPELLNADVKTGLRPISRRQFKKGGKVMGECSDDRADRKKRKSGGRLMATEIADAKVNRNVKDANELRPGIKHVGALKTGGRAKKANGGGERMPLPVPRPKNLDAQIEAREMANQTAQANANADKDYLNRLSDSFGQGQGAPRKAGGRTKKYSGGPMAGANRMIENAQDTSGVGPARMSFTGSRVGKLSPMKAIGAAKNGGKIKHDDEAMDKALIKKMVKSSARTGKNHGGPSVDETIGYNKAIEGLKKSDPDYDWDNITDSVAAAIANKEFKRIQDYKQEQGQTDLKRGGRAKRATGGQVFSGPGYPGKVPGVVPGGRTARAGGGKAGKGKTNINIVIAGKPQDGDDMGMPPKGLPPQLPQRMPIPAPAPAPGGMPPMGPAMSPAAMPPMPMPPPGAGAGPAPTARKHGGRLTKVAHSYKDMTAGSGGGEGRLEKTDIAKLHKNAPSYRRGGKIHRSYKDMDAGAGSGEGRLEKSEIQHTKRVH